MKRKLWLLITTLIVLLLAACGGNDGDSTDDTQDTNDAEGNIAIDELTVGFVPSREPEEIITATEPLKELLTEELAELGYDVENVEITVGTNYEAVGEGLSAGTIDVGLIPGGTYVLYDDGAEVILTATREGLSIESDDPRDWNENKPTEPISDHVTFYRALIIAGPSEKGQELAEKVNNGEELTLEELNEASWGVMSSSSPAGYIYPALWLNENYGTTISELDNVVQIDSYGSAFSRLAVGQLDIMVTYADARRDNEDTWDGSSIWDETNVIGVTAPIYNDTVSVSKNSDIMDDDLKAAIQQAFINIGETEEGQEVISIYNHLGYQKAEPSDYDDERKAQDMIRDAN